MPEPRARLPLLLLVLALGAPPASAQGAPALDPALRPEYDEAAVTILCDCGCHPQTVADCSCGRADEMRKEIAAMVGSGGPGGTPMSGEQVIDAYVARHGEKIRIAPTTRGFNLVAWLGPGVVILGAAAALVLVLRRWRRRAPETSAPAEPAPSPDDPWMQRLESDLRDSA